MTATAVAPPAPSHRTQHSSTGGGDIRIYRSYYEDTPTNYDDLFSVAKAFGVTTDEVQALLDYGCSEEEIEEMLYDPELFHEMTGELLYAY